MRTAVCCTFGNEIWNTGKHAVLKEFVIFQIRNVLPRQILHNQLRNRAHYVVLGDGGDLKFMSDQHETMAGGNPSIFHSIDINKRQRIPAAFFDFC